MTTIDFRDMAVVDHGKAKRSLRFTWNRFIRSVVTLDLAY